MDERTTNNVCQTVTDRIIEKLQAGVIPWKHFSFAPLAEPKNLVSGKPYRGINHLLLSLNARYASPYWLTYRQAAARGGYVRKGEKSEMVVFWKFLEGEGQDRNQTKRAPLARSYHVFNVEQCENVPCPAVEVAPREVSPVSAAERIEAGMPNPPRIDVDDVPKAYYSPSTDRVHMCSARYCISDERFHSTLLHELVHATNHPSRLNREEADGLDHAFGSKSYCLEELVAEIGSAFLCAKAGIFQQVEDDQAAYIENWMGRLRQDNRLILSAAGKAQKAAACILGETLTHEEP